MQNVETGETRCKVVKATSFGNAGWSAFQFIGDLRVKTGQIWDIMSLNDINFNYDPKRPIA